MSGFGAIVSFEVGEGAEAADAVCAAVKVISNATSLGGVETLVERRARYPEEDLVPENLMRISVGIEHVEDLWADLERAIAAALTDRDSSLTAAHPAGARSVAARGLMCSACPRWHRAATSGSAAPHESRRATAECGDARSSSTAAGAAWAKGDSRPPPARILAAAGERAADRDRHRSADIIGRCGPIPRCVSTHPQRWTS